MDSDRNAQTGEPPVKKFRYCWGTPQKPKKDFSELPYEILMKIFQYLDFRSVAKCAMLCRKFYQLSNDSILYSNVHLKYNMDTLLMTSYINKIEAPRHIYVEYKFHDPESDAENYCEFNEYVTWLFRKCCNYVTSLQLESCRDDSILVLLCEFPNLTEISCYRCKGNFDVLPSLKNLTSISFISCEVPSNSLSDTLRNNPNLKKLYLSDNSKVNVNEICETLSQHNYSLEEVHFCENKKVRAKELKALSRCSQLRVLELIGGPLQCDPEDSLEMLAAGCPHLEKLKIHGWKDVNDENLMPVLHFCTQLKELDLRGIDITIKFCREAILLLPHLKSLDVYKCSRIKNTQILRLQKDFQDVQIYN